MKLPHQSSQDMYADPILLIFSAVFLAIAVHLAKRSRSILARIPGPAAETFLLGNLRQIFQSQAGERDFEWIQEYGDVVRVRGVCGENRLLISDPKALQYIFQTSGYNYEKWPERTEISRILMGRGLLWADGLVHKRQRKVMLPGFGAPECKSFVPIFLRTASQLTVKWSDILTREPDTSATINVATWLSRATMDSLGEAAFDYQFGALAQKDNDLMKAYFGLMNDTLGSPPSRGIFLQTTLPLWALQLRAKYSKSKMMSHTRHTADLASQLAETLVRMKGDELLQRKGQRDVLSLLVKANASENAAMQLTHEEMVAQMRTLLLAGHETSATSLCWVLLEVAKHHDVQQRMRREIRAAEASMITRGDSEFTAKDLDGMTYTIAVMKEAMRLHPALYHNYRRPVHDDVLPLSTPIRTTDGKLIHELPIPKGTKIFASIAGYNRNKSIWGQDADEFNPDRWLVDRNTKREGPSVGVYGNLLTFSGGVRSCIGWRFAVYEVQALLTEIVNHFELSPTPELERLRREACLVMIPTLEGQQLDGENLPLRVSLAPRDV